MARFGYIPFDEDREDQKAEDKAEKRALKKMPSESVEVDPSQVRFGGLDPNDPEFENVETFAEYLDDDERETFMPTELACLNARTGRPVHEIRVALEAYGFKLPRREKVKDVRTFGTNPNTRWSSCPTHGGGGGGCIMGMADPG